MRGKGGSESAFQVLELLKKLLTSRLWQEGELGLRRRRELTVACSPFVQILTSHVEARALSRCLHLALRSIERLARGTHFLCLFLQGYTGWTHQ